MRGDERGNITVNIYNITNSKSQKVSPHTVTPRTSHTYGTVSSHKIQNHQSNTHDTRTRRTTHTDSISRAISVLVLHALHSVVHHIPKLSSSCPSCEVYRPVFLSKSEGRYFQPCQRSAIISRLVSARAIGLRIALVS